MLRLSARLPVHTHLLRVVRPLRCASTASASPSFLSDERIRVTDPEYNRWLQLIPASIAGVGIGTYASVPAVLGPSVCRAQGVVAQAPIDFAMSDLMPIATCMPLVAGVAAAGLASQSEGFGFRRLSFLCSVAYPLSVYGLSAAAISAHNLPAFAASYALLGGLGFYCGYPQLPPFLASTWFPDRRGLVMSIYFSAFGAGMLFAVPVIQRLLSHFRAPPTRLGSLEEVSLSLGEGGQRLATIDGERVEVVVATTRDLIESGFGDSLQEGVFLLGTGSNGVCETMVSMGAIVFGLMHTAAWSYRLPMTRVYHSPPALAAASEAEAEERAPGATSGAAPTLVSVPAEVAIKAEGSPPVRGPALPLSDLTLAEAMRTPNMYFLFLGSVGVCMSGLPYVQLGKFMINDIFGTAMGPTTAVIAAGFPSFVASANIGGRLLWGPVSDRIGCSTTSMLFGTSVPALLAVPYIATGMVTTDAAAALSIFKLSALCSIGVFAGMPVLLAPAAAEVFGGSHSGEIYRRLWLTVPLANFIGTTLMSRARDAAYARHAAALADGVDEATFAATFGTSKADVPALVASKALTLPLLLSVSPEGTVDPSPFLYDDVFCTLAGCSAAALACNIAAFRLPVRMAR